MTADGARQAWLARSREVSRDVLRVQAPAVDRDSAFPAHGVAALQQAGLLGLMAPGALHGRPGAFDSLWRIAAELGAGCLSTALIWAMHSQQVAVLARHAAVAESELLSRVATRGSLIASVTTEPVKGGDLLRVDAALQSEGTGWHLMRQAPIVSYGEQASCYLVTMRRAEDRPRNDVVLVRVERDDPGTVRVVGPWDAMGMRGTRSVPMEFDLTVDCNRLLEGSFREMAVQTMIPVGHLVWAAAWYGCAAGRLDDVLATLRDKPGVRAERAKSDLFLTRLGEWRLSIDLLRCLIERAAQTLDALVESDAPLACYETIEFQILINNLKLAGARLSFEVVDGLIELVGMGQGYLRDSALGLERSFRDLRAASLMYHDDRLLKANGMLMLAHRPGQGAFLSASEP